MYLPSDFIKHYHIYYKEALIILTMLISIFPMIMFIRKVIFSIIRSYIDTWNPNYDKIIKKHSLDTYLLHMLLSVYLSLYLIFWHNNLHPIIINHPYIIAAVKDIILILYTGSAFAMLLIKMLDVISDIYRDSFGLSAKVTPLSLYVQIPKIIIACIAIAIITSSLLNISLGKFLTSLGAVAALLTFLFKDIILGVVASMQLIAQDIIRIGDKITIKESQVDGIVENITINVVKIRNFDQSISTIPTSFLLRTNVANWRGVKESAARKIQRAIHIDISSIMFISDSFLNKLKKSSYLSKAAIDKVTLEKNNYNDLTNIKLFRLYVLEYLKNNPNIHQKDFTLLVRQLAFTTEGMPIELCVFTDKVIDSMYEEMQAEIFDHLFAVLPEFKLKVFQK